MYGAGHKECPTNLSTYFLITQLMGYSKYPPPKHGIIGSPLLPQEGKHQTQVHEDSWTPRMDISIQEFTDKTKAPSPPLPWALKLPNVYLVCLTWQPSLSSTTSLFTLAHFKQLLLCHQLPRTTLIPRCDKH